MWWILLIACQRQPGPVDGSDTSVAVDTVVDTVDDTIGDTPVETSDPLHPPFEVDLFPDDHVLDVVLTMAPDDWLALRSSERDMVDLLGGDCLDGPFPSPFVEFDADLSVDGISRDHISVKKKGFIGSMDRTRPSLKLDLDDHDGPTLDGLSKITLNNNRQDPSSIRSCMASAALAMVGVPAPRCALAHVTVNGEDLGVYSHVETMDVGVVPRLFGDADGDLYEGTLSDLHVGWYRTFEAKTDATDASLAPLLQIASALDLPDNQVVAGLDPVVDLPAFFTLWAAESLIGHWDGYSGNRNNFFVYVPDDGRARFLPWGMDATFGKPDGAAEAFGIGTSPVVFQDGRLAARLYAIPAQRTRYRDTVRALLSAWDDAALVAKVEQLATLAAPFQTAPDEMVVAETAQIRSWTETRRAVVQTALDALPAPVAWAPSSPCFTATSALSFSFETTWDSRAQDPYAYGSSTLTAPGVGAFVGGAAAYVSDSDPGRVTVRINGYYGLAFSEMTLTLDPAVVAPGVWQMNGTSALGVWYWAGLFPAGLSYGVAADGVLTLDAAGMAAGDVISGRFDGTLFQAEVFRL